LLCFQLKELQSKLKYKKMIKYLHLESKEKEKEIETLANLDDVIIQVYESDESAYLHCPLLDMSGTTKVQFLGYLTKDYDEKLYNKLFYSSSHVELRYLCMFMNILHFLFYSICFWTISESVNILFWKKNVHLILNIGLYRIDSNQLMLKLTQEICIIFIMDWDINIVLVQSQN